MESSSSEQFVTLPKIPSARACEIGLGYMWRLMPSQEFPRVTNKDAPAAPARCQRHQRGPSLLCGNELEADGRRDADDFAGWGELASARIDVKFRDIV